MIHNTIVKMFKANTFVIEKVEYSRYIFKVKTHDKSICKYMHKKINVEKLRRGNDFSY